MGIFAMGYPSDLSKIQCKECEGLVNCTGQFDDFIGIFEAKWMGRGKKKRTLGVYDYDS